MPQMWEATDEDNGDMIMKQEKKEWVFAVYCRVCHHWFFDSFDREKSKNPKYDVAFICPFCSTELWVR